MQNRQAERIKRRKKIRRRRIVAFIVLPILTLILAVGGYAAYLYYTASDVLKDSYDGSTVSERAVNPADDNVSVLFMGVDDSDVRNSGKGSRTDALLLATFNDDDKTVKLLSIPRDSYVYIPDKGTYSKITHAHAYGGVEYTINTVENLLQVPVDYYVKMNFNAFVDVVDALGGITVDVPYTFSEQNSKDKAGAITIEEGTQTLDGEEALAFARTRKKDSDIERGKRQQQLIQAIVEKASSASSITKYANVIQGIGKNMKTNMTFAEMKGFTNYVMASDLSIESLNLKGSDSYINNVYYYQLDEANLASTIEELQVHMDVNKTADSSTDTSTTDEYAGSSEIE
ncbi:transcriptional regulator [Bacillus sp. FJAT-27916]|uniref:LCP family protein n=1 Tax=Bacillus sp. FJAT-27916 TaxID=1679169 RepID=UPI000670C6BD|nr:LCP family protein [Bacillus sp. FJAT-27916]KMY43033.1 transcriptional regulator [Bacillus sp. FJAT-27916]